MTRPDEVVAWSENEVTATECNEGATAAQGVATTTCRCGAPCRKEVLMRGGDHGWGDDESRTILRYVQPIEPQGAE